MAADKVGTFWFHCAHWGTNYRVYEACVNGNTVGVILMTRDKDGETWFETRIVARGYEENEVWEEFKQSKMYEAKTADEAPATPRVEPDA